MNFPQYRKYKNIANYFIIHSEKHFEEIKVIGTKYLISEVEAVQYPEQLLIQDMLDNREGRWETVLPSEFESWIDEIKNTKTKIG